MSDLPEREAFSPRFAVTHEMTEEGLRIVEDQVVTADPLTGTPIDNPPLGELVRADPVMTEEEVENLPLPEDALPAEEPLVEEPQAEEVPVELDQPVAPQSFGQSF